MTPTMTDEPTTDDATLATGEAATEAPTRPAVPDAGGAGDGGTDEDDGSTSRLQTFLVVGLAVWCVVMLVVAAASFLRADNLASAQDDRREASSVASAFASATLSYDHRDLEGSVSAVTDLATAEYAETYQTAFFEELQPVVDEMRARGTVNVRDVYLSEISDDTATAVVSFDAVIRSTIGTRRLSGSYVRIDLVKEASGWKADELTFLATTQEGLDPAAGSTGTGTTATTAPAG